MLVDLTFCPATTLTLYIPVQRKAPSHPALVSDYQTAQTPKIFSFLLKLCLQIGLGQV